MDVIPEFPILDSSSFNEASTQSRSDAVARPETGPRLRRSLMIPFPADLA